MRLRSVPLVDSRRLKAKIDAMTNRIYRQRLPDGSFFVMRDTMQYRAVGSLHKKYEFTFEILKMASQWESGIYAICRESEVIYIGKSQSAYYRVFESIRKRVVHPEALSIRFWCCLPTELDEREHEAISYFKPSLNRKLTQEARPIAYKWEKPKCFILTPRAL